MQLSVFDASFGYNLFTCDRGALNSITIVDSLLPHALRCLQLLASPWLLLFRVLRFGYRACCSNKVHRPRLEKMVQNKKRGERYRFPLFVLYRSYFRMLSSRQLHSSVLPDEQ